MKLFCGFAITMVLLAGCGSQQPTNRPPVYPVSGKITYKGAPVAGADIKFDADGQERAAFGRTDDQGNYKLTTFGSNDGAVEGKHSVSITKYQPPQESVAVEADTESPEYVPPGLNEGEKMPELKNEIPDKYAKPETSGLVVMVNSDGENKLDFELTD